MERTTRIGGRLDKRVAIVTGSGGGIGRSIAERFAEEGAAVVIAEINPDSGRRATEGIAAAGGRALFVQTDVSKIADVDRLVRLTLKEFDALNILVNNASCPQEFVAANEFDPIVDVCLRGTWHCTKAVLDPMRRAGGGAIVNLSSVSALMGFFEEHIYSAVKGAIISLTRSMAVSLGRDGIRVNAICPGTIETEGWGPTLLQEPSVFERLAKYYPIGRIGKPSDVASAALFLASEESSFVTGSVFVIDGGITAGHVEF